MKAHKKFTANIDSNHISKSIQIHILTTWFTSNYSSQCSAKISHQLFLIL